METETIKIDKLQDVSQWTTWRFQVKVCLNAGGLFGIASDVEKCPAGAVAGSDATTIACSRENHFGLETKRCKSSTNNCDVDWFETNAAYFAL